MTVMAPGGSTDEAFSFWCMGLHRQESFPNQVVIAQVLGRSSDRTFRNGAY